MRARTVLARGLPAARFAAGAAFAAGVLAGATVPAGAFPRVRFAAVTRTAGSGSGLAAGTTPIAVASCASTGNFVAPFFGSGACSRMKSRSCG